MYADDVQYSTVRTFWISIFFLGGKHHTALGSLGCVLCKHILGFVFFLPFQQTRGTRTGWWWAAWVITCSCYSHAISQSQSYYLSVIRRLHEVITMSSLMSNFRYAKLFIYLFIFWWSIWKKKIIRKYTLYKKIYKT